MKKIVLLALVLAMPSIELMSQMTVVTSDKKEVNISKPLDMDQCEKKGLKLIVPITEEFKKYDLVEILLYSKNKGDKQFYPQKTFNLQPIYNPYYPKSATFQNKYKGKKEFEMWILQPGVTGINAYWEPKKSEIHLKEYKLISFGYFKEGEKKYWSKKHNEYRTRPVYGEKVMIVKSQNFTFKGDEKALSEAARKQKAEDNWKEVFSKFNNTEHEEGVFSIFGKAKKHILKDLSRIDELTAIKDKLISMDRKSLNKLIKKAYYVIDEEEVIKIIQEH